MRNRLRRQWQISRDAALKAEVNRLQKSVSRRQNEWRNDKWSAILESLDPKDESLRRITKRLMGVPHSISPLDTPRGFALSESEKVEALVDNLETQFHPVTDPSVTAVIEIVDVALRSYFLSLASEPQ